MEYIWVMDLNQTQPSIKSGHTKKIFSRSPYVNVYEKKNKILNIPAESIAESEGEKKKSSARVTSIINHKIRETGCATGQQ